MNKKLQEYIENKYYKVLHKIELQAWESYADYYGIDADTEDVSQADNFIEECFVSTAIDDGQEDAKLELWGADLLPFSTQRRINESTMAYTWNGQTCYKYEPINK